MADKCTARPGTVSYVCVCGISGRLGVGPDRKIQDRPQVPFYMVEHLGWAYVRPATGENKTNGWDYEGLCPECQELDT